jgi:hypothetical protein
LSESTSAVARKKAPRGFHGWFGGAVQETEPPFSIARENSFSTPTNPQPFGWSGVGSRKSLTLHVHHNLNSAVHDYPQQQTHAKTATSIPSLLPGPLSTPHAILISRPSI